MERCVEAIGNSRTTLPPLSRVGGTSARQRAERSTSATTEPDNGPSVGFRSSAHSVER